MKKKDRKNSLCCQKRKKIAYEQKKRKIKPFIVHICVYVCVCVYNEDLTPLIKRDQMVVNRI